MKVFLSVPKVLCTKYQKTTKEGKEMLKVRKKQTVECFPVSANCNLLYFNIAHTVATNSTDRCYYKLNLKFQLHFGITSYGKKFNNNKISSHRLSYWQGQNTFVFCVLGLEQTVSILCTIWWSCKRDSMRWVWPSLCRWKKKKHKKISGLLYTTVLETSCSFLPHKLLSKEPRLQTKRRE